MLRMGATKNQIADAVRNIWSKRDDEYSETRGKFSSEKVEMSFIGG